MSMKKFLEILDGKKQLNEDISECGEMQVSNTSTPPVSMNINLSAQGINNIKDVLNLINMVDNQPTPMDMPAVTAGPIAVSQNKPDELHDIVKKAGLPVSTDSKPEEEGIAGALGGGALGAALGGPMGALQGASAGSAVQDAITSDDTDEDMSMSEYGDSNFTIDDIKELERMNDIDLMKDRARELINTSSKKKMKPEKIAYFMKAIDKMTRPVEIIKLMYDLLLSGEGHGVIGSKGSMSSSSYRRRFTDSFENEPNEEYQDHDYMIKDLAGGLNKPHKQIRKGYPGSDNAMTVSMHNETVDTIKDRLLKEYNDFKEGYWGWDDPRYDEPEEPENDYGNSEGTTDIDLPAPYDIDVNDEDYNVKKGEVIPFDVTYNAYGDDFDIEKITYGGFDNIPLITLDFNKAYSGWSNRVFDIVGELLIDQTKREKQSHRSTSKRRPETEPNDNYTDPATSFNAMSDYEKRVNRDH